MARVLVLGLMAVSFCMGGCSTSRGADAGMVGDAGLELGSGDALGRDLHAAAVLIAAREASRRLAQVDGVETVP